MKISRPLDRFTSVRVNANHKTQRSVGYIERCEWNDALAGNIHALTICDYGYVVVFPEREWGLSLKDLPLTHTIEVQRAPRDMYMPRESWDPVMKMTVGEFEQLLADHIADNFKEDA